MKIAFVSQPWDTVSPSATASIGMLTYQVSRGMAQNHDVIVYTKGGSFIPKVEHAEGIQYRRVSLEPDIWLLRMLERLPGSGNVKRPLFASSFYYLGYILQVAKDLRQQKSDVVHVHNFSQLP